MNRNCDCEEWKSGRKALDGMTTFAWTHGIHYTGGAFKFCPWCGKELIDSDNKR
jgi:hypothetical protein